MRRRYSDLEMVFYGGTIAVIIIGFLFYAGYIKFAPLNNELPTQITIKSKFTQNEDSSIAYYF